MIYNKFRNCNGNKVKKNYKENTKEIIFSKRKLHYRLLKLKNNQSFKLNFLKSYTLYVVNKKLIHGLEVENANIFLKGDDSIKVVNEEISILSRENIIVLIAGTKTTLENKKSIKVSKSKNHYKVVKPWGYEVWISSECKDYAFKKILINKSFKTSLQYHKIKEEINLLYNGVAKLIYQNPKQTNKLIEEEVSAISSIHIKPNVVHRIKAETKIILFEISTPHLDDVIRIEDDFHRKNGRIKAEHLAK